MKDNDKTLIVAYLDGETTDQETTYINKLIKEDQDAYENGDEDADEGEDGDGNGIDDEGDGLADEDV